MDIKLRDIIISETIMVVFFIFLHITTPIDPILELLFLFLFIVIGYPISFLVNAVRTELFGADHKTCPHCKKEL